VSGAGRSGLPMKLFCFYRPVDDDGESKGDEIPDWSGHLLVVAPDLETAAAFCRAHDEGFEPILERGYGWKEIKLSAPGVVFVQDPQ